MPKSSKKDSRNSRTTLSSSKSSTRRSSRRRTKSSSAKSNSRYPSSSLDRAASKQWPFRSSRIWIRSSTAITDCPFSRIQKDDYVQLYRIQSLYLFRIINMSLDTKIRKAFSGINSLKIIPILNFIWRFTTNS